MRLSLNFPSFYCQSVSENILHLFLTCRLRKHCQKVFILEHETYVSSYADTFTGFSIQELTGRTHYVCDSCTEMSGKLVSGISRAFITRHLTSDSHTENSSHRARSEAARIAKATKLAADLHAESAIDNSLMQDDLPPQLPPPKRPRPSNSNMDEEADHLHDVTFSAGLSDINVPKASKSVFRVLIPLDKFGEPADDFDITASAIGDEIQRAGVQIHCLFLTEITMLHLDDNGDYERTDVLKKPVPRTEYFPYKNKTVCASSMSLFVQALFKLFDRRRSTLITATNV